MNDPLGLALIVGLTIKELPFLTLVIIAAAGQIPLGHHLRAARALGHGPGAAWAFAILPQLYPLIRLPIFVVLAFSLSVVDMAVILGPSNPPVLAVAMTRWFQSGDLGLFAPASAAALLQAALVLGAILIWMLGERLAAMLARAALWSGIAFRPAQPLLTLACGAAWVLLATGLAALVVLVLWSFAQRWTFPDAVPESWSLRLWLDPGEGWGRVALRTGLIGLAATALSLVTAILWLEGEARGHLPRAPLGRGADLRAAADPAGGLSLRVERLFSAHRSWRRSSGGDLGACAVHLSLCHARADRGLARGRPAPFAQRGSAGGGAMAAACDGATAGSDRADPDGGGHRLCGIGRAISADVVCRCGPRDDIDDRGRDPVVRR